MVAIKREIVEFEGIRTFFFPNLALYASYNEEQMANHPEKAHRFAAHVFGATKEPPTEQDILDIIFPENANSEALSTGLDACLALGGDFISHFNNFSQRLNRQDQSHDMSDAIGAEINKKKLALIGRKARLQKSADAKILSILVKIMMAEENLEKFLEICELCTLDLDFDAYVLIKLLKLETEENAEEVEIIRENVIDRIEKTKPILADLMRNGPVDEFTRLLFSPIEESSQKLAIKIIDLYKESLASNGSLEERSRLTYQLIFIIMRSLAAGKLDVATLILLPLSNDVKIHMFPTIKNARFEKTIVFACSVIQIFMKSGGSFKNWKLVGVNKVIDNSWSRRAIIEILDDFAFSINSNPFDVFAPLFPGGEIENNEALEKMNNALRCSTWILENYGATITELDTIKGMEFFENIEQKKALLEALKNSSELKISVEQLEPKKESVEMKKPEKIENDIQFKTNSMAVKNTPVVMEDIPSESNQTAYVTRKKVEDWLELSLEKALPGEFSTEKPRGLSERKPNEMGGPLKTQNANSKRRSRFGRSSLFSIKTNEATGLKAVEQNEVHPPSDLPNPAPATSSARFSGLNFGRSLLSDITKEKLGIKFGRSRDDSPSPPSSPSPPTSPAPHTSSVPPTSSAPPNSSAPIKKLVPSTSLAPPNPLASYKTSTPPTPNAEQKPKTKKYERPKKVRPPTTNNFLSSGFGMSKYAEGFGKFDLTSKRRLFGGVGLGEARRFGGYL